MVKWTVRLDDEQAATYRALCDACGVTLQALLEATIGTQVGWFEQHDRQPPEHWDSDPTVIARWHAVIADARRIDAEKRSRR